MYNSNQIVYNKTTKQLEKIQNLPFPQQPKNSSHMIWTPKAYRELPKDEIKEHCIFAGKKMYPLHDGIYNGGDIEIANWYYNHKYIIPAFLAPQWEKERELRRERSLCLDKLKNDLQMTGKHLWWLFKLVVKRKKYSE